MDLQLLHPLKIVDFLAILSLGVVLIAISIWCRSIIKSPQL